MKINILNKFSAMGILLLAAIFSACDQKSPVDYILISGTITNTNSSYVTVKGNDYSYDIDSQEDGTFSDTIRVERGYYLFYSGRERATIFLDKGYSLNITLDQALFDETLAFTGEGDGTKINNYLANKARKNEALTVDFQTLFGLAEADFIAKMEVVDSTFSGLLLEGGIKDKDFINGETRNINYEYLTQFVNYPSYHEYVTKDESFAVSDGFSEYTNGIDYTNEADYKALQNYRSLLSAYFSSTMENDAAATFDKIKSIPSSHIKSELAPSFSYDVQPGNPNAETIFNGILSLTNDSAIVSKLTVKMEKIRKLDKGMPSSSFDYIDINDKQVTLADLKGKYLYVDVWATWCGPCLREIPSLKQLEADFHSKNIAFVSISVDAEKDYEKWKTMVAEKDLKGVQLFADNSWQSDFVQSYAIDGIPRFILIDPSGNIVDPNAPRPSDPKTRALFEKI